MTKIKYLLKILALLIITLLLSKFWLYVLNNHYNDSNIFGIYIENNMLHVGDFWAAVWLIIFPWKGSRYLFQILSNITEQYVNEKYKSDFYLVIHGLKININVTNLDFQKQTIEFESKHVEILKDLISIYCDKNMDIEVLENKTTPAIYLLKNCKIESTTKNKIILNFNKYEILY